MEAWCRCDYEAVQEALNAAWLPCNPLRDAFTAELCEKSLEALTTLFIIVNRIDKAMDAIEMRQDILARGPYPERVLEADKSTKPSGEDPKDEETVHRGSTLPEWTAGPWIEPREWILSSKVLTTSADILLAAKKPAKARREDLEAAVDVLGALIKDATAISGADHPRVGVVFSLLGHAYAQLAQLSGGGLELLAEASFRKALKTIDTSRASSFGAYSSFIDLTKARLAAVLRKDPRRINEADQLAGEVEDARILKIHEFILVHGVHGKLSDPLGNPVSPALSGGPETITKFH